MAQDRCVTSNGYVLVRDVDGIYGKRDAKVPEHRLVMAKKLGRPLSTNEHVHHIDLDKTNNDPSNLKIMTAAEHGAIHRGGNRIPRKKVTSKFQFAGRSKWVKLRCPQCGKVFFKPRSQTVLSMPNKYGANFCSIRCAALYGETAEDMRPSVVGNIICEFSTNGRFMREFLSGWHHYWEIDDNGEFHS